MTTITSKDLQKNQSKYMKRVARGEEFEVTFHGKSIARVLPAKQTNSGKPRRGSYEAVMESFKYARPSKRLSDRPDYKQLRDEMMKDKFGF